MYEPVKTNRIREGINESMMAMICTYSLVIMGTTEVKCEGKQVKAFNL